MEKWHFVWYCRVMRVVAWPRQLHVCKKWIGQLTINFFDCISVCQSFCDIQKANKLFDIPLSVLPYKPDKLFSLCIVQRSKVVVQISFQDLLGELGAKRFVYNCVAFRKASFRILINVPSKFCVRKISAAQKNRQDMMSAEMAIAAHAA